MFLHRFGKMIDIFNFKKKYIYYKLFFNFDKHNFFKNTIKQTLKINEYKF